MSIRLKVLVAVTVVAALLFVALFIISNTVVLASFEELEQQSAERNVERVVNALSDEISTLKSTNADWAHWDATYDFVRGDFPDFPELELSDDTIANLNWNLLAFLNVGGELVYATGFDTEEGGSLPLPEAFMPYLSAGSPLLDLPDVASNAGGFFLMDDQLVMASAVPVLTSSKQGPIVGTMVIGRYVDSGRIAALSESLRMNISLFPLDGTPLPAEVVNASEQITTSDESVYARTLNDSIIAGYALLHDLSGQPAAALRIQQDRSIYAQGLQTVNLQTALLVLSGVVLGGVVVLLLDRLVIHRMTRLGREVDAIHQVEEHTQRVTVDGSDEIAALSGNINQMLNRLDESSKLLEEKNLALTLAYQQAQEATRLKSEFLSTMSHELRTPLNSIIGYAGIMLEGIGGEIDDEARRMISNMSTSGQHLLKLINAILDLSKIEAGRMEMVEEDVDIRDLVDHIESQMSVLAVKKNLAFEATVAPEVPTVLRGDSSRIAQILINLLSNALKFTEKGHVTLDMRWNEEKLVIRVIDTGIGIPPHAITYIFDEFRQVDGSTQRSYGGTGLGLAIVRKLSQAMGGTVTVESEIDQGSTFKVTLPLKPTESLNGASPVIDKASA
jgi:signal transduction histidine kinase